MNGETRENKARPLCDDVDVVHHWNSKFQSKKAYQWLLEIFDDYGPIYDHITPMCLHQLT